MSRFARLLVSLVLLLALARTAPAYRLPKPLAEQVAQADLIVLGEVEKVEAVELDANGRFFKPSPPAKTTAQAEDKATTQGAAEPMDPNAFAAEIPARVEYTATVRVREALKGQVVGQRVIRVRWNDEHPGRFELPLTLKPGDVDFFFLNKASKPGVFKSLIEHNMDRIGLGIGYVREKGITTQDRFSPEKAKFMVCYFAHWGGGSGGYVDATLEEACARIRRLAAAAKPATP